MMKPTPESDRRAIRRKQALERSDMTGEVFDAAFTRLHGNLYVERTAILPPRERIAVTARCAPDDVVVGGIAAKIMHGGLWHDGDFTIELLRGPDAGNRPGRGRTVARRTGLTPDDVVEIDGIAVTSVVRTAFDLGRVGPPWRALGHLDDLARATGFGLDEVRRHAERFAGHRGVRQLRELIPLVDGDAESPPESWVRLLMHRSELPTPELQIEVADDDGQIFARIDLGYVGPMIAIEFDGADFHTSPAQRARDGARDARLRELGWIIIRIDADRLRTDPWGVVMEIERALRSRGGYF
ncbi:endonuclease domain-containing protein [Gordonia sp. DT218]|uniref:endonuclease domain-containing protein n=1 Tax=Gordonia sp. DT218 TaxID=3416659 RepID=UPI003CE9075B